MALKGTPLVRPKTPRSVPVLSRVCAFFIKLSQLGFRNLKFRQAAIKTDDKLWKHPHDASPPESWEMNTYLRA